MQCPKCGAILVSTATRCDQCNTAIKAEKLPKPKTSVFPKIVAVLLFVIAGIGVYFGCQHKVCLSGTWQRNFQTDQPGVLIRQEYQFNPFGVMSRHLGERTERGKYELFDGGMVFTQTNAFSSETISYELSPFGKLYVNGEAAYPYTISGLSLSHTLFLVSFVLFGLGVFLFLKRPKLKFPDDEDEDDIEYEVYEEDDEEEATPMQPQPTPQPIPRTTPVRTPSDNGFVTHQHPDELFGVKKNPAPTYGATPPAEKITDSDQFHRAGDL